MIGYHEWLIVIHILSTKIHTSKLDFIIIIIIIIIIFIFGFV